MTDTTAAERRETVPVSLGDRSYDIHIGEGILARAGDIVAPFMKRPMTAIVTDENVAAAHLATLERALASRGIRSTAIVMPPGEATKSYKHLAELCDRLLVAGIERRDRIIAFGGGVIGDLAGFAAAILRRGVDFIQIPTTLLSQVNSSVGGKTGINSPHGKNLIGAFHQPLAVITDIALLDTLPRRELAAGYAEVAKYGLLGDAGFFEWLEGAAPAIMRGDTQARIHAIRKSCEAKAQIVAEDETETGVRALLNLGHTFGHALESATGYSQRLLHGEGVSIGMVQAFRFSERQKLCAARHGGPGGEAPEGRGASHPRQPDPRGTSAARDTSGHHAAGQEGTRRPADLHPHARHRRGVHRQGCVGCRRARLPDGGPPPAMSLEPGLTIAALVGLLVLSAVLSAARTALAEASRTRLSELHKKGEARAERVMALLDSEERTSGALALWHGAVLILAGAAAALLLMYFTVPPEKLAAAVILILAFAFLGFALPKAHAAARPEAVAMGLCGVISAMIAVTGGMASMFDKAARAMLRQPEHDSPQDSQSVHEELRETIDLHIKEGTVIKNDRDMLSGILAMQDLEVADIMVHRTKMTMIDGAEDAKDIVAKVLKSGHTRIPVWKETPTTSSACCMPRTCSQPFRSTMAMRRRSTSRTSCCRRGSCRTRARSLTSSTPS